MTIRDYLLLRKRRAIIFDVIGLAIFVLGLILAQEVKPLFILAVAGVGLGFVSLYIFRFNTRCPQCKGNLATTINMGNPFSVSIKIKYCPYCSVDLDSSMPQPRVQAAADKENP
jgi:hypothetical protein